ncbi:MAG: Nicotinamide-nucleotide adenylyltransferase [Promethearchaeota archaeon]|nr:MAG: Nicotinamide-nucleotide adenylyltransferase [Candidatus Lokiarchaeota archaeon]
MEDETLACIKKDEIKYLHSGQISKHIFPVKRKEAHKKGIPHLIVRIFIIKKNQKDRIEYLVQKRGKNKKTYPGYYTDSASGHVVYEKNLDLSTIKQNAYRELEEEFGLKSTDLIKLNFYDFKSEKDKLSREVAYIFVGVAKTEVEPEPNEDELDINDSKFYTRSELQNIFEEKEAVDYSEEIWKELLNSDLNSLFEDKESQKKKTSEDVALFVGRFQPLHHGHIHVIYRIFEDYNFLKIAIGSSQISHTKDNPFTKEERKQFITTALKKRAISEDNYSIYYVPDIFNANKWVDHLVSIVGNFDIVYSNSDWVRELFKNEGYELSKKITIFKNKYSGTHIRNLISNKIEKYRLLIPNEVLNKMEEFNGVERIQDLYKEENNNE